MVIERSRNFLGWAKSPGQREQIDALLAGRKADLVTAEGWRAIDAYELQRGRAAQRPRVKLASREQLLAAARNGVHSRQSFTRGELKPRA